MLALLAAGMSDREIANQLGLAHATVRSTLESLYRDTRCAGRVALVVWYLRYRMAHELEEAA